MTSTRFSFAKLLEKYTLSESIHKITIWGLLAIFSLNTFPFLFYDALRMLYLTSIDYNEGWNVFQTLKILKGEPLYGSLSGFPLVLVNYPPLSFFIIGGLSFFTGSILLTGRIVAYISLLALSYLIFKIIENLTSQKTAALLGALLWLAIIGRMAGNYVGMHDPQLLANTFSLGAFYFYFKWEDTLTFQKVCVLAFFCSLAMFVKHLSITVPIALGITLLFNNRKSFWIFTLSGIMISSLMFLGSWLYAGRDLFFNFLDLSRALSNRKLLEEIISLFRTHFLGVVFLPFLVLLIIGHKKWFPIAMYFVLSFILGFYVTRGVGVDRNAWFDFFIASAIVFGLFAAGTRRQRQRNTSYIGKRRSSFRNWLPGLAIIFSGLVTNEFVLAQFLSSDGVLERSTILRIRILQTFIVLSGFLLLVAKDRIAALLRNRFLFYVILFSLILPFSIGFKDSLKKVFHYERLKQQEELYRKDVELLKSIQGPALFEESLLGFHAEKEFLFDSFNASQMMVYGRIPEHILTDKINQKYFRAIILTFDLEKELTRLNRDRIDPIIPKTTLTDRWTDNTLIAINDHYELLDPKRPRHYFFYLPRNSSP
jgi:hypothetical protein